MNKEMLMQLAENFKQYSKEAFHSFKSGAEITYIIVNVLFNQFERKRRFFKEVNLFKAKQGFSYKPLS